MTDKYHKLAQKWQMYCNVPSRAIIDRDLFIFQ